MTGRKITAALAALALGAGLAAGCNSDRETRESSNQGNNPPQGGAPTTVDTGQTTLQSTGSTQPTVTDENAPSPSSTTGQ